MTTSAFPTSPRDRAQADHLNIALWTLQGWLTMFFVAAGYGKLTEPMDNLIALMKWPALASESFVRGLGVVEVVLAVMVLAPLVSWRIGRPLLLTAVVGLLALEVVALGVHALNLDVGLALTNVALLAITAPILWFRRRV